MTDISIVVATYNREDVLAGCLAGLFRQDCGHERYEVVIADDGSVDGTKAMLASLRAPCHIEVVSLPENRGQTAAMNAGAACARGKLLLFLDDDMQVGSGLVGRHLAAHESLGADAVVFGPIVAPDTGREGDFASLALKQSLREKFERLAADPRTCWPQDAAVMPNSSLPRRLFMECGGFDEVNFARRREDEELGVRLWKAAVPFVFEPRAAASHHWVKSKERTQADWREGGAALVRLFRKHPDLRGTQATFSRLLRLPRVARWMIVPLGYVPAISSLLIGALTLASRAAGRPGTFHRLCSLERALFTLNGALREAGTWGRFTRMFRTGRNP